MPEVATSDFSKEASNLDFHVKPSGLSVLAPKLEMYKTLCRSGVLGELSQGSLRLLIIGW